MNRSPASAEPMAAGGPLSESHLLELDTGRRRLRRIRRAASVATFSGWTLAGFGSLTLLGVVFGSLVSLVLGGGLIACGVVELRGASRLRRLDLGGPRQLGWNQLALAVLIGAYAGWRLVDVATGDPMASAGGSSGDPEIDALVGGLYTSISYAVYGTVLVVGTAVPILTARYYFSRSRHLRAALHETPEWVIRTLRAAA